MVDLTKMNRRDLQARAAQLSERYQAFKAQRLALDMTRGKPCPQQLDLSLGLLDCLGQSDYRAADGSDCRNYGGLDGLPEARALFAEFLEVDPSEVIVGGNSSLAMMHDTITQAVLRGMPGGTAPWRAQAVKFLCPSPGYDRHFAICQHLGIDMLTVGMTASGPDMDEVEGLVAADGSIKGIWCVPKYSNPTGCVYSDATVRRIARLPQRAGRHFLVMWDNAYAVHDLDDSPPQLANITAMLESEGTESNVVQFTSTSKITFAGAGVAFLASSRDVVKALEGVLGASTIGPDKINQLRHVRFLEGHLHAHMQRHAALIRPKFGAVLERLEQSLAGLGVATWTHPVGGYFVSR